jgi:hypothetical protein
MIIRIYGRKADGFGEKSSGLPIPCNGINWKGEVKI